MAIIKSYSPFLNLSNYQTFIVDTNPNSDFFRITEFKETFTGGKNGFLIEGSPFLKETTEVKIEILDVEGNPIYFEPGSGTPEYYEGLSTLISVHIYPDTPIGIGKITILGELKEYINQNGTLVPVPDDWKGVYNVKWEKTFKINRNLSNEDSVRFYRRPVVSISELVKPIFSKTIPNVTQSGSVDGIALQPIAGANLSNWTAGTLYKLKITDGPGWTGSVDENVISIPSLDYSPIIREVLNSSEVLVDIPYSTGNIVTNFTSQPYTTTFEWVEGQQVTDSALTGSFAKINISNLKTFVGDVARVKVYRKSRNEVTDYQFVQESKLESTELLRDITISDDTQISYGNFTDSNLNNYWTSSNSNHPISLNVDVLQSSAKIDYNYASGGLQNLITSESFSIAKDVEYTLSFKTLLSGSIDGSEYIKAYLSGSDYQQTFLTVSGSNIYKTRQTLSQNIIASPISSSNAKLVFEVSGSDWYISNVSLKNAQETSFSPDEFILIQDIPRKLISETFDFKFEFYDINNNYIPVDVFATATFDGGNDYPTSTKILTFDSDRNSFRFATGSIGNPTFQTIGFTVSRQNLVGAVTYGRSVFDLTGSYIDPSVYSSAPGGPYPYPGEPTNPSDNGFITHIDEFTGSLQNIIVGSITYTASCDGLHQHETVYRLEDGDNAPGLFASSTANQFIYKATDLSLNPSNQVITFDVRRKNLGVSGTTITINSGSETGDASPLTLLYDDPSTAVATYYLSGSIFNYTSGSATYFFSASDGYGIDYHDAIKITPIKILDGLSVTLTNENASLPAKSTGFVESGSFSLTSGSVNVKIGNETITHSNGLAITNSFDIISATATDVLTGSLDYSTNNYWITELQKDSGSLNLLVRYKDGSGETTDINKLVTFTKSKKSSPTPLTKITPATQTINSSSVGFEIPQTMQVVVQEGGTEYAYSATTSSIQTFKINGIGISAGSASFNNDIITIATITSSDFNGSNASASISYIDSEGTHYDNKLVRFDLSVSKTGIDGAPGSDGANGENGVVINLSPTSQVVKRSTAGVYGTPSPFTVQVIENGSQYTHTTGSLGPSQFKFTNIINGVSSSLFTTTPKITPTTPSSTAGLTTTFNVIYKTSTGIESAGIPQSHSVSVTLDGVTGPGVVHTGIWEAGRAYQYSDGLSDGSGRRDVVLWSTSGTAPYDTYYAATTSHTSTNDTNASTGKPGSGPWVSLGTQDFFVAAKIGIFEESYVQETLNIGTNNNGGVSSANITLRGGTAYPYISIGQSGTVGSQGYGVNGIFIGSVNDSGTKYKLSLKSDTNALLWNGTDLIVTGSGNFSGTINASGGNFTGYVSAGTSRFGVGVASGKNGIYINSNNYWYYDTTSAAASFKVGDASNSMVFNAGSLSLSGNLTATSGTITGGTISGGSISIGTAPTVFSVTSAGALSATGVSISGSISATDGLIGGFNIGSNYISGQYLIINSTEPYIKLNDTSNVTRVQLSNDSTFSSGGGGSPSSAASLTTNNSAVTSETLPGSVKAAYIGKVMQNAPLLGASNTFSATGWSGQDVIVSCAIASDGYFASVTSTSDSANNYVSATTDVYFKLVAPSGIVYTTTTRFNGNNNTVGKTATVTGTATETLSVTMENGTWTYSTGISYGISTASDSVVSISAISTTYKTPDVTAITLTYTNELTEISAAGIQVVGASSKKVIIPRDNNLATAALQVTGFLTATGNIIAYYSDKRLKNILGNIENPLEKIEKLNGVYYTQSDKAVELGYEPNDKMQVGLIAQEVEEVLPEIIHLAPIDIDSNGESKSGENYLSVDYDKVVPLLVESIKELKKEIEELKRNK